MKQIILASTSPRRKMLMAVLGLPFKAVASNYHEVHHPHLKPAELVRFLAEGKARALAAKYPGSIIIGADTIVVHRGEIFGKPKSLAEAAAMLKRFSGTRHYVLTGVCVLDVRRKKKVSAIAKLDVYFRNLNRMAIKNYLSAEHVLDKAGAYAVQGLGMGLIEKVSGELTNGVGLPLVTLARMFKKMGVKI